MFFLCLYVFSTFSTWMALLICPKVWICVNNALLNNWLLSLLKWIKTRSRSNMINQLMKMNTWWSFSWWHHLTTKEKCRKWIFVVFHLCLVCLLSCSLKCVISHNMWIPGPKCRKLLLWQSWWFLPPVVQLHSLLSFLCISSNPAYCSHLDFAMAFFSSVFSWTVCDLLLCKPLNGGQMWPVHQYELNDTH